MACNLSNWINQQQQRRQTSPLGKNLVLLKGFNSLKWLIFNLSLCLLLRRLKPSLNITETLRQRNKFVYFSSSMSFTGTDNKRDANKVFWIQIISSLFSLQPMFVQVTFITDATDATTIILLLGDRTQWGIIFCLKFRYAMFKRRPRQLHTFAAGWLS